MGEEDKKYQWNFSISQSWPFTANTASHKSVPLNQLLNILGSYKSIKNGQKCLKKHAISRPAIVLIFIMTN